MIVQLQQDETGKLESITFIVSSTGEDLKQKAKQWLKAKYPTLALEQFLGKIRSMDDNQIRMDAPGD
jgi:hypothetical protein